MNEPFSRLADLIKLHQGLPQPVRLEIGRRTVPPNSTPATWHMPEGQLLFLGGTSESKKQLAYILYNQPVGEDGFEELPMLREVDAAASEDEMDATVGMLLHIFSIVYHLCCV